MKHKLLSFIVLLTALAAPTLSRAYDFSAVAPSGQTLYYNIVNGEAQVTYQTNTQSYTTYPTGDLTIPSSVTYNGTTHSVTSIGGYAFSHCVGLTSVTIPNSVTYIGIEAFAGCNGLTSLAIGNSVNWISEIAFLNCTSLTSVTIPASVEYIEGQCFVGCSSLTSIIVDNENSVYDSRNSCNAIIETATNTLIEGCKATVIPNTITAIESYAFGHRRGLISIAIPASVSFIGRGAFRWCEDLTDVTCLTTTPSSLGEYVFTDINSSCTLTVPCGSEQVYQSSDWGTYFTIIQCDEVGIDDVEDDGRALVCLYPNPAHSSVTVAGLEPGQRVTLVNLYGRTVADLCASASELTIDVSTLMPGTYFVRAEGLPARTLVVAR